MSIHDEINQLVQDGALIPYRPRSRHAARRRLYLTKEANDSLNNSQSAISILVGRGFVEAALTRWVLGELIWARSRRGKRIGGFLLRLLGPPPEVWEIRVIEPSVQARLLCRFAAQDVLIVTGMHTRQTLGKKGSISWRDAMAKCEEAWKRLFPKSQPFRGAVVADYILENFDDFEL